MASTYYKCSYTYDYHSCICNHMCDYYSCIYDYVGHMVTCDLLSCGYIISIKGVTIYEELQEKKLKNSPSQKF
jgi:hypothetical protein